MRKPYLVLMIIAAITLFLAGCSTGSGDKPEKSTGQQAGSQLKPKDEVYKAVNTEAFKGFDKLAFILEGKLYVLNADTGLINRINKTGLVLNPKLSANGEYLAFITITDQDNMKGNLWIAKSDGSQTIEAKDLKQPVRYNSYTWSPKNNTLAVCAENGTYLIQTDGNSRLLIKSSDYMSAIWSPNGKQLAYNLTSPYDQEKPELRSDALYTVDISSGKTTQQIITPQNGIMPLAWWPDCKGLLYWLDPCHSASIAADGLDLYSLPLDSKQPIKLQNALPDEANIARLSDNELIMVVGSGREIYTNKTLAVVNLKNGSCRKILQPLNSVVSYITLSPDSRHLAYTSTKDLGNRPNTNELDDWFDSYALWIASADGTGTRELKGAGTGISLPQWSNDSKYIVFLKNSALWIMGINDSDARKILPLSLATKDKKSIGQMIPSNALFALYKGK